MEPAGKIIWGLLGKNRGDNTQIEVLCRALGNTFSAEPIFKNLTCQKRFVAPNILRRASLNILSSDDRNKLKPDWPDVVVGTGRKSVAVARWIQQQSNGRTKLIWIGRPKAPLKWFDLIVTTPQYGLPDALNVYKIPLPLVPETDKLQIPEQWKKLKRPLLGVLVGGENFPLLMDEEAIVRLGHSVRALQGKYGGSCLVSTSPRTGKKLAETLKSRIPAGSIFYLWEKNGKNPYREILSCADRFIVTGDSATMLAEACQTGKPVEIFALKRSPFWPRWQVTSKFVSWLVEGGILAPPRDVSAIHDVLEKDWLEKNYDQGQGQSQELGEIMKRVEKLIGTDVVQDKLHSD